MSFLDSIKAIDIINQHKKNIKKELSSRFQKKSNKKKKAIKEKFGSGKEFVEA